MPRLSEADRNFCLGLIQAGVGIRQAARQLNCYPSTVSRLLERVQQTGSTRDRPRTGQPRVTTPAQDRHIVLSHLRNRFLPAAETARATLGTRENIAPVTARRRLSDAGLHARRPHVGLPLSRLRRQRRLQWARNHQRTTRQQWNSVLSVMRADSPYQLLMDG